jgi:hypothetical protein
MREIFLNTFNFTNMAMVRNSDIKSDKYTLMKTENDRPINLKSPLP